MDYFNGTKTQIAPCILSKAKYALNIKKQKPSNNKKCSLDYWIKVIKTICNQQTISDTIKKEAIRKYKQLIK